tara:strand:- start:334 stop:483 length:150 start_codon:yes stop_codon:yes gene_type:complete
MMVGLIVEDLFTEEAVAVAVPVLPVQMERCLTHQVLVVMGNHFLLLPRL